MTLASRNLKLTADLKARAAVAAAIPRVEINSDQGDAPEARREEQVSLKGGDGAQA
jgi:hypothetical protein